MINMGLVKCLRACNRHLRPSVYYDGSAFIMTVGDSLPFI